MIDRTTRLIALLALIIALLGNVAVYGVRAHADEIACREVEVLKNAERQRAIDSYNNLDQTLKLLKLKRTPEIEQRALNDRNTALKRFASENCDQSWLPFKS